MKVFVAGAGGYIGMVLCAQLVREGHDVTAFDRFFFGKIPAGCRIVAGDTRTVAPSSLDGHDAVVDLAGLSNDASCEIDSKYTSRINFGGGKNLFIAAIGANIRRYIYASSASVYGHGENRWLTETAPTDPLTNYSKSKLYMEEWITATESGMETVILRNATVFGVSPRMRFDLAVNVMTMRAWRDKVIYVMGGGQQLRPFIHVQDVARAIIWALTAPREIVSGQIFNIGSNERQCTIAELAHKVASMFPDAKIHQIPDETDQRSYHLSFDKYLKASGFVARKNIEHGIGEVMSALNSGIVDPSDPRTVTLQWYKSMLEWQERLDKLKADGPIL